MTKSNDHVASPRTSSAAARPPRRDGAIRICFTATLLRPAPSAGGRMVSWAFVNLPVAASAGLRSRGQVCVESTINAKPFRGTLEPDGRRGHWAKVSRRQREAAGVKIGDSVAFEIWPTGVVPEPRVPADLRRAMQSASAAARETWRDITPAARMDWIHWITSSKRAETRTKRIGAACEMLAKGKRRPCCFDRSGIYGRNLAPPATHAVVSHDSPDIVERKP